MGRPPLKKAAIERSALELFVEKGIDGTSIRDIAERADVTEGALYRHHRSKDDLVRALFFQYYAGFAEMIATVRATHESFRTLLPELVDAFFSFYDKDPYVFHFLLLARHKLLDEVRQDDNNPVELLSRIVSDAVEKGEIKTTNPALTTQLILGMVTQAAIGVRYRRIETPLARHSGEVARSCLLVAGG